MTGCSLDEPSPAGTSGDANTPPDPPRPKSFRKTIRISYTRSVRITNKGDPFMLVMRAAKRRGVSTNKYIVKRVIACALAELQGRKQVDLGSLED